MQNFKSFSPAHNFVEIPTLANTTARLSHFHITIFVYFSLNLLLLSCTISTSTATLLLQLTTLPSSCYCSSFEIAPKHFRFAIWYLILFFFLDIFKHKVLYLILRCSSVHVYSTFFRVKKLKCTCVINLHELFFRFVFVFIPLPHIYLLMIVIYSYFAHWLQLHLRHARCIILTKKIASTFLRLFNLLTVFFLVVYCAEVI